MARRPALEWYPPGRLVMWAAFLAVLFILVGDRAISASMRRASAPACTSSLLNCLQVETGEPPGAPLTVPGISNAQRLIDFLVSALPLAGAVLATITNLLNLWLAGRVVKFSGRLTRPWPELAHMSFPEAARAGARGRRGRVLFRRHASASSPASWRRLC